MINEKARNAILNHAAECYPRESCGVIINGEYIPCENISPIDSQFIINPRDLAKASKLGKVSAYVHSHPDGTPNPSIPDLIEMSKHGKPWIITNGVEIKTHLPKEYAAPLLGREYYHGLLDCYTLIQDYYSRELNITLGDYEREDAWWEKKESKSLYIENFEKEGFRKVNDLKKHDVILFRLGRTEHINHAAIYLGDGKVKSENMPEVMGGDLILHHPYNSQSVRQVYGGIWQRRTAEILRHKSL